MKSLLAAVAALSFIVLSAGCTVVAPTYQPDIDHVQVLKKAGDSQASVAGFTLGPHSAGANNISLRGSSMESPYAKSYPKYVEEALRSELQLAERLSKDPAVQISGTLIENDLDASGFSTGEGVIKVRFVVKHDGNIVYDEIKEAHTQWESSFVGGIAIPNAVQAYPKLVDALLDDLYADPAFLKAIA